jgi:lipoprotein NlpI
MRIVAVLLVFVPVFAQDAGRAVMDRAVADFSAARIDDSVRGFDRVVQLSPNLAPYLWQRGIALYYAGRYKDCRAQFESHRTVNPNDVENAAWHYLCVARDESPQRARAALLPVGPDARRPMREVLDMFAGKMTPADVLRAAGDSSEANFYAHLYIALYAEGLGKTAQALEEIRLAADPKYQSDGGYMHMVARVHLRLREKAR